MFHLLLMDFSGSLWIWIVGLILLLGFYSVSQGISSGGFDEFQADNSRCRLYLLRGVFLISLSVFLYRFMVFK